MAEKEYIEREAALDIVNGWRDQLIPAYGKNDEYVICLETVAEHLESLHAADVRPVRRGKWEKADGAYCGGFTEDGDSITLPTVRCSVCKKLIAPVIWKNFCPNCGAWMEES